MSTSSPVHAPATSVAPGARSASGRSAQPPRRRRDALAAGSTPRPRDLLMLFAVGAVVCIVSLPRLDAYARLTNERDARSALLLFATSVFEQGDTDGSAPGSTTPAAFATTRGATADDAGLGAILSSDRWLAHRLRDARPVGDGSVVLHHGYHFALEGPTLFAWPRRPGRTGQRIYAFHAGAVYALPSARARDFDAGSLEEIVPSEEDGWQLVR